MLDRATVNRDMNAQDRRRDDSVIGVRVGVFANHGAAGWTRECSRAV